MNNAKVWTFSIIALTMIGALASFFIPLPADHDALQFYSFFALGVAVAILNIGAAILFIKGFGAFKARLQRAYIILCIGLIIYGLAFIQLPILMATGQLDSLWYHGGIIAIPFIAGATTIFAGARSLTRLFSIKTWAQSYWVVIAVIATVSAALAFMPHTSNSLPEINFDAQNALATWGYIFFGFMAINIWQIKRAAGVAYADALAWLFIAALLSTVMNGFVNTLFVFVMGPDLWQITAIAVLLPSAAAGLFFLRSAYGFNRIGRVADTHEPTIARTFFGKPLQPSKAQKASPVDIVVYVANLVSNRRDIDPILDSVRLITARHAQGHPISPQDEEQLLNVYLQIEQYLLTKEPLRAFTKETLRQDVAQKLQLTVGPQNAFWSKLT
jgi:hypothetical protein